MSLTPEQESEIERLRNEVQPTIRATSPALEEILLKEIKVLDHGFIRVIDYMGSDESIVQAARVSYGKGTKKVSEDKGLINYLLRHRHSTPFEMCEIKLHVKLPIFVARQWIRHRTANVNEYSARYSILDKEFYIPDAKLLSISQVQRKTEKKIEKTRDAGQEDFFGIPELPEAATLAAQSKSNKQGRDKAVNSNEAVDIVEILTKQGDAAYKAYIKLLNERPDGSIVDDSRSGVARELARMVLPTNVYTQWYWKIDLHNFMHFLSLRADPHAQYEIRVYADAMLDVLKRWTPLTYEAFEQHRLNAVTLSKGALGVMKRMMKGEKVTVENSGLGKREWAELMAVIESRD